MDVSKFNKYGKHFDFPDFENNFVLIQPAGFGINIGIKGDGGDVIYNWLLLHPFFSNYDIPSKSDCGWKLYIDRSNKNNETKIIFQGDTIKHTLTITCTNENLKPKPIKIQWK